LVFVENFLCKCSELTQKLEKLSDGTENKLNFIIYDRWRYLLSQIQDLIVNKGFESCFYCNPDAIKTSDDESLNHDVEFVNSFELYLKDLIFVLEHDKSALKKSLRMDQSNYY
jgi:hypothetical protein